MWTLLFTLSQEGNQILKRKQQQQFAYDWTLFVVHVIFIWIGNKTRGGTHRDQRFGVEWNKCERYYPSTLRDGYRRSFPKIWRTYLKGQEIIERISANCSECSTFGSLKINPHIFYWNFLKIYKIIIFEKKKVTTLFKKKKKSKG